ncbi:Nuclear transport factor 2, Eukaryote [Sarocladium implicatum]|nr:Nuclear transport factor 2, Eukaryote [Sarocladium implicatum]
MPLPNLETEVRASTADIFVSNYYQALNSNSALLPFYVNSSNKYTMPADISINGAVLPTPEDYQKLVEAQGHGVRYDVESLDTQVMNPSFQFGAPEHVQNNAKAESGARMSIVVMTTGKVQYGKGREAPQKMFNETFVLVPNWDALKNNPPRGIRKWLIMSQNFRAL